MRRQGRDACLDPRATYSRLSNRSAAMTASDALVVVERNMPRSQKRIIGEEPMAFVNGIRRQWRAALALCAVAVLALLIGRYLKMRSNYDLCEAEQPRALTGPAGQMIEMDTRFCSPLAGDPGTIVVRFRRGRSSSATIVFAYNPASPGPQASTPPWYPQIAWNGSDRVLISISRLSQVQRQRFEASGVHFAYRIGKVDYPSAS